MARSTRRKTTKTARKVSTKTSKRSKTSRKTPNKTSARARPSKAKASVAPSPAKTSRVSKKVASKGKRAAPAKAGKKPRSASPAVVSFTERAKAPEIAMAEARPLRIVVFGASGSIGQRIAKEALTRGHHVTAVMRHPDRLTLTHPQLRAVKADATDPLMVATIAKGHDAIVSAIAPSKEDPDALAEAATSVLQGAREAGIKRVMVVNGAGSLRVGPGAKGKMLMDTPQFPADWKWVAKGHKAALDVLQAKGAGLDWTAVSPAAMIEPGKRTGRFRTGGEQLLADARGDSRISIEDYAAAFMDELEGEHNVGKRMSVAY